MDKTIENILLKTSMEIFLRSKLRESERDNDELAMMITNGVKVSGEELAKLKTLEAYAHNLVKTGNADERHQLMCCIADLLRT